MAKRSLHPLLHYLRRLGGSAAVAGLEDAQLLHRFVTSRDESAFATIVQRYGAMVWGLCVRRLGETPEAEDAFQATFLVLVRKAASLRDSQSLGPWLYGVANRTASKLRGKRARRSAREAPLPEQLAEERPESVWAELRPVLDEEINRLPTKYRLPVLLCYLQGLSNAEAARQLGCAKGTIFSRLSRARDLLRSRLLRRGVDLSAGALAAVLAENAAIWAMPAAALREMTIRTSLLLAAGTAGQSLSAPLAALVEGVVRSMFLSKVKFAVIILLALGLVGSGAGFVAHRTGAEQPASNPASVLPLPAAVAHKEKDKSADPKPKLQPDEPAELGPFPEDASSRLQMWHKLLFQTVDFPGLEDPRSTLSDALEQLSKRYGISFRLNEKAFKMDGLQEVGSSPVTQPTPIPPFKTSLATILGIILDRVPAVTGVMYLVRKDHIEITTSLFVRAELGFRNERPLLPLVCDAFDKMPLAQILPRLAETSGYNVFGVNCDAAASEASYNMVVDPRAKEQLETPITAQFNNVPVDTVLRLLTNMAGLSVVRLDNVFYVTTAENAKQLREEQAKINADMPVGPAGKAPTPAPEKSAK